jgi:hypothetical protein
MITRGFDRPLSLQSLGRRESLQTRMFDWKGEGYPCNWEW